MHLSTPCGFPWRRLAAMSVVALAALLLTLAATRDLQDPAPDESGKITTGELLIVSIDGLTAASEETRLLRRVSQEGEIWLPLLDEQPLVARDLTPGQLQNEIRRAYQRKGIRLEIIAVARAERGEDQQLVVPHEIAVTRR